MEMSKEKKSKTAGKAPLIVVSILLVLTLVVNVVCIQMFSAINTFMAANLNSRLPGAHGSATAEQLTPEQAKEAALAMAQELAAEGIVLLENKDRALPLESGAKVNLFGYASVSPLYGGTGSGASDESANVDLVQGLTNAGLQVNQELVHFYKNSGVKRESQGGFTGSDFTPAAVPAGKYGDSLLANAKAFSDTAVVIFSRIGSEGGDLPMDMEAAGYSQAGGNRSHLELTQDEEDLLALVKGQGFGKVIVLVNSSHAMELGFLEDGVDAALWIGGPGSRGMNAVGQVLAGAVNPSGRLPDTYAYDHSTAPAYWNAGDFTYSNLDKRNYVEYVEGIYVGYRFYETRFVDNATGVCDEGAYGNTVQYPFGYGLSYTSFRQELCSFAVAADEIRLTVRVTNTGTRYAGQDVVQVYFSAPYTELDRQLGVEKPAAALAGFGKTGLLAPGEHEDVPVRFALEDMASYCSARDNGDGTSGCYLLEDGTYTVSLRADSHTVLDTREVSIPAPVWYDGKNPRQGEEAAAVNRFAQLDAYMSDPAVSGAVILSRSDWQGTQPTAPTGRDRRTSDTVAAWIAQADSTKFDCQTDPLLGNVPGSAVYRETAPAAGADNGLVLADLRGRSYRDPLWSDLLDQLTFSSGEELRLALFECAYKTGAVDAIGKPVSLERDGPQGLTFPDQSGKNWISGVCGYPAPPVLAASWNLELAYAFGEMVGQEALLRGINGWYAPGLNLHRSPFNGRCSEYFSEDPLLAGLFGARVVSGAGDAGLSCAVKHLGPMDTEAHRNPHTTVWLTEQALREIYLRPFELALKNAEKTVAFVDEGGRLTRRVMGAGDFIMVGDCAVGSE